jgi:hypothetical protein
MRRYDSPILRRIRRRTHPAEGRDWRVVAMTRSKLPTTSAGTRSIPPALIVLSGDQVHHIGRRSALLEQLGHRPHRWPRVSEKQLQARTEIVLTGLAVARECEPVLWTAAIAKRSDLATLALRSERIALVISELALFGRGDELQHVSLVNISQLITRFDEMIAGVEIAVVLQGRSVAAGRGVDTEQMTAEIGFERHVEELNVNTAHVVTYPLLEDIYQETAVLFAPHRAFRYQVRSSPDWRSGSCPRWRAPLWG